MKVRNTSNNNRECESSIGNSRPAQTSRCCDILARKQEKTQKWADIHK